MKVKLAVILLALCCLAACKKDTTVTSEPAKLEFDFGGAHHSYNIDTVRLQVIDTGANAGKYLYVFSGYQSLPQVRFNLVDKSYDRINDCFQTGNYGNLLSSTACNDTVANEFCLGFIVQYADTGVGHIATLDAADSLSTLSVTNCSTSSGKSVLNASFSCVLVDPTGYTAPRTLSNGRLSNLVYTK